MALPLIPFAAGVALGSLFTLGAKDQGIRDHIVQGTRGLMDGAKNLYKQGADGVGLVYDKAAEGVVIVYKESADGAVAAYDKAVEVAVVVYKQTADGAVVAYEKAADGVVGVVDMVPRLSTSKQSLPDVQQVLDSAEKGIEGAVEKVDKAKTAV